MRALYWQRPTAAEAGELGLKPEDFPEPHVDVWSENWDPLVFYSQNMTQWRVGAAGPFGLDYGVVMALLQRKGLAPDEFDDFMQAIRWIEDAALTVFSE